jgi:putative methyltransferase (TIGR04325 family)
VRNRKLKEGLRLITPPLIQSVYRRIVSKRGIYFTGNYQNWTSARADCVGYEDDAVIQKVYTAALKVKKGEAVYERDSVIFDEIQFSWPVISALLYTASHHANKLSVLDYGGALGSSYFQSRSFLSGINSLRWSIVEQPKFVELGKKDFEDETLRFYLSIEECMANETPQVVLLSSVLQYLPDPHALLDQIVSLGCSTIVLDMTAMLPEGYSDRLTIQHIPKEIYLASYPAWFFSSAILDKLSKKYDPLASWDVYESWDLGDVKAQDRGYTFVRRV